MPAFNLSAFLPYRLSILSNRISNAISRTYKARFGLTVPEWRILAVLGDIHAMTARDIAAATEMDKVTVSRATAKLVERELIQSEVSPEDGRSRLLRLSETGQSIFDEVTPLATTYEANLMEGLTVEERETLTRLIDKLYDRMDAIPEPDKSGKA